jgi:hypothetical protein
VSVLDRVAARTAGESPLWTADLLPGAAAGEAVSQGLSGGHALGVEMIREGYLLHRRRSRLFSTGDDGQRLLTGDYLYAAGLREICATGDLAAVAALAGLISACAAAQASGADEGDADRWRATLERIRAGQAAAGSRRGSSSPASASGSHQQT